MKKANLGLIGLGTQGKIHLRNRLYLKNANLVAVSDTSEKSLHIARKAGVKRVFKNYGDLLKEPSLDAVIISLPTFLHAETAIKAAEYGKQARAPRDSDSGIHKDYQTLIGYHTTCEGLSNRKNV